MYGLVNRAIRQMVEEGHGKEVWNAIRERAKVDDVFVAMEQYPDDVTIALVQAACAELGADGHTVLKAFGDYWVAFTGEAYGDLFEISGETFVELVRNLNNLHARVGQIMPELKPPSFHVTDETVNGKTGTFKLHYRSIRPGLHPMILGLMEGLGRRFNTDVSVRHLRGLDDGLDHDEFIVEYRLP